MAKHRHKSDLPVKQCCVCMRPFVWRKKWSAVWEDVKYCSQRCRGYRGVVASAEPERSSG
ncbi:MAG: DUF2256 domain-containing protein [Gammaproteobacteria bacterium]|nr:DUF2256 domain-containing protein [Gammaproteobacteria bacterium]MCH1551796.1 DUF2256 domain-containing protein [Pseudomonadales bacterium]